MDIPEPEQFGVDEGQDQNVVDGDTSSAFPRSIPSRILMQAGGQIVIPEGANEGVEAP